MFMYIYVYPYIYRGWREALGGTALVRGWLPNTGRCVVRSFVVLRYWNMKHMGGWGDRIRDSKKEYGESVWHQISFTTSIRLQVYNANTRSESDGVLTTSSPQRQNVFTPFYSRAPALWLHPLSDSMTSRDDDQCAECSDFQRGVFKPTAHQNMCLSEKPLAVSELEVAIGSSARTPGLPAASFLSFWVREDRI